jgi:tetratricopeptide (TPR) repeat protein
LQAQLTAHRSPEVYVQIGKWFDTHHRYKCAAGAYRSALKLSPASAESFLLLGSSLDSAGDFDEAASALEQAVRLAPDNIEGHLKLAAALEQARRRDEAEAEWNAALKLDGKSVAALHGLSQHLLAEGNYAQAIKLLQGAPQNETLALDLTQAYGKAGDLTDAAETAKKALEQTPGSFPLTYMRTTILVDLGRFQEATQLSQKYAEAHPDNLDAQRLFLHLLVTTNDTERAQTSARALLVRAPNDAYVLYVNGMLERQAGDLVAAQLHLQKSIALDPNRDDAHYNLGLILLKSNDYSGARTHFERAIALGDKDPEVHFQLSKALRALGASDQADKELKLYRDAAEAQSELTVAQAKATMAEKELASDDPQKAIALYREALDATPDDALLHFKLGMALDRVGDTAAEKEALEKAIHIDPDMAIAHNQLGYLASRSGDSAGAEEHFRQAVRAAPAYAEAWVNLAATLGMESKIAEARQAVANALKADPKNTAALELQQELSAAPH